MSIDFTSLRIPQNFVDLILKHKDKIDKSFLEFVNLGGSSDIIDLTDATQRTHWHNMENAISHYILSENDHMTRFVKQPKKIVENDFDQFCQFYRWMSDIRSVLNSRYPNEAKWIFPTQNGQNSLGPDSNE